jgi:hypothetical protein
LLLIYYNLSFYPTPIYMRPLFLKVKTYVLLFFIVLIHSNFSHATKLPVQSHQLTLRLYSPSHAQKVNFKPYQLIKRVVHIITHKPRKTGEGSIALVIIGAILLTLLLGFGIFILAYGGLAPGLLAIIGIVGFLLIIFGAARIIRNIKSRTEIAQLLFRKIQQYTARKKSTTGINS